MEIKPDTFWYVRLPNALVLSKVLVVEVSKFTVTLNMIYKPDTINSEFIYKISEVEFVEFLGNKKEHDN